MASEEKGPLLARAPGASTSDDGPSASQPAAGREQRPGGKADQRPRSRKANERMQSVLYLLATFVGGWCIGAWVMRSMGPIGDPKDVRRLDQIERLFENCSRNDISLDAVDRLLSAGCGRRGFQKKEGIVNPEYWQFKHRGKRDKAFQQWMSSTAPYPSLDNMHPPFPATAYPHCQVYVNHHYKFIWIKGHKVGSTAMRGTLGWLCDDHWKVPKDANFSLCSNAYFGQGNVASEEEIAKVWGEYFVFGVVRNPFTRFASAHEYITGMMAKGCRNPLFNETCMDPYLHAKTCAKSGCCPDWMKVHHWRHFSDQSTCLFNDAGRPAVDFIAETEAMDEDMDTILETINSKRDEGLPPLAQQNFFSNVKTPKNASGDLPSRYLKLFKESDYCLFSLLRIFKKDVTLLQYVGDLLRS